jgi:hypothetical protein
MPSDADHDEGDADNIQEAAAAGARGYFSRVLELAAQLSLPLALYYA